MQLQARSSTAAHICACLSALLCAQLLLLLAYGHACRRHSSVMAFRPPGMSLCCAPSDWEWNATDEDQVRQLLAVLAAHS